MNETDKFPPDLPGQPDLPPPPPAPTGKARFQTSEPVFVPQLVIGVLAGAATAASVVASILGSISAQERTVVIAIHNYLSIDLADPRAWVHSGRIAGDLTPILAGEFGVAVATKNPGPTATGAVGVVTWRLGDSEERLAVLYSAPYDYHLYKNWFKLAVIDGGVQTDKSLYEDMYYDKGRTPGKAARADGGAATWQRTLHGQTGTLTGTMGTEGRCLLNVDVRLS